MRLCSWWFSRRDPGFIESKADGGFTFCFAICGSRIRTGNPPWAQWRDLYRVVQIGIGILMHPVQMLCESGQVRLRTCLCCIWVSPAWIVLCSLCDICLVDDQEIHSVGNMVRFVCNWPICVVYVFTWLVFMTMELTNGTYLIYEWWFNVNPTT